MKAVLLTVEIEKTIDGRYIVIPVWADVDRPKSSSYSCNTDHKLAERLAAAILAGVVLEEPSVQTDIHQQTYVSHGFAIRMRCANADLKRLGY